MTAKPTKLSTVHTKAGPAVVEFVVSLLLSTGLVGGCTYLLFDFREHLEQMNRDRAAIAKDISENARVMQLVTSWSRPEYQQDQNLGHLYQQACSAKSIPQLDPRFRREVHRRAAAIAVTLTTLKGDVTGADFSTPVLTRYQESLAQTLQPQIEMATILRDVFGAWETLTTNQRTAELERIRAKMLRQVEKAAQHVRVTRDAMAYYQHKVNDDQVRNVEIRSALTTAYIKIGLSGAGIFAGLVVLYCSLARSCPNIAKRRLGRR